MISIQWKTDTLYCVQDVRYPLPLVPIVQYCEQDVSLDPGAYCTVYRMYPLTLVPILLCSGCIP